MFVMPNKDRSRLIKTAMGEIQCDLTIENVQIVDVITGSVYPARVDIIDGVIAAIRQPGQITPSPGKEVFDGENKYLIPGYIDMHVHVESTMMTPENFGKSVVVWGTTTVVTDPHEIVNVDGIAGAEFMLKSAKRAPLRQFVLAPSCVPAVPKVESAGAAFFAPEIAGLLEMEGVLGIAEIMDFWGVCNDDPRMHGILGEGLKRSMFLQGHAPGLRGDMLNAYLAAGVQSDHESMSTDEILEKSRLGMQINTRAAPIADSTPKLAEAIPQMRWHDTLTLCTDDVPASDLLEKGHISRVANRLIELGIDPLLVIRMGTYNAAREYNFSDLGAIAPGRVADLQLIDSLEALGDQKPAAVFVEGKLVSKDGKLLTEKAGLAWYEEKNTVCIPQIASEDDLRLQAPDNGKDTANVVVINTNLREQMRSKQAVERAKLPIKDGFVEIEDTKKLQYICVANRYGTGSKTIAVASNFGLTEGAMATTVLHDSHNLIVIYADQASGYAAVKELERIGGGMCLAKNGEAYFTLPLPIGGLMSPLPAEDIAPQIQKLHHEFRQNSESENPDMLLGISVLGLPVRPGYVITDIGIVNGDDLSFVPVFGD